MTREAFGNVYENGKDRTIRFLLSRGVDQEAAADITQTAWLRAWEKLSQLRDETMIVTWVNTIALNFYRRSLRRPFHQEVSDSLPDTTSPNLAAIDVARIIDSCRPRDRVLLEAQIQGLTPRELARREGVSETAIRIRFLRARRSVRQGLEQAAERKQWRRAAAA